METKTNPRKKKIIQIIRCSTWIYYTYYFCAREVMLQEIMSGALENSVKFYVGKTETFILKGTL